MSLMKTATTNPYAMATDDNGTFDRASSLYTACKAIVGVHGANVTRDRRLVAFWDGHAKIVKVGHGATLGERTQITTDGWILQ